MRPSTAVARALLCAVPGLVGIVAHAESPDQRSWDPKAAAAYLDSRAAWWMAWPSAARDHGTFCVSCHTALPYVLARPALRAALREPERTYAEARLLDNVVKRVTLWKDVEPFYPDQLRGIPKTSESRATEAILNALILASRDAEQGRLSDETRTALGNMWALQMRTQELSGAWAWLNFGLDPWESATAPYFGAALAVLATGTAPGGYAATPEIQPNIKLLQEYFRREDARQPLFNRLVALWVSARAPGLIGFDTQSVIDAALGKQQQDGGWSTASLGDWKRKDGSELDKNSDAYATGLVTLAFQQSALRSAAPQVARGLEWLRRNQDRATGQWPASSLNKQRDPLSDAGRFMSDAATAFAVLSLTHAPAAR